MKILVVHGPNLNLLGEARGDPLSYAELNRRLEVFAAELGATLKIVQSNHEGVLIDTLQAERDWADAILINPAALTHTSYPLRECLRIVGKPTVEVHLEDIRRRETWRRKSVMKDVCEAQVMGKGLLSYLDGLERLATGKYGGVRKGRSKQAAEQSSATAPSAAVPVAAKPAKTIGRVTMESADPTRLLQDAANTAAPRPAKTIGRAPAADPPPVHADAAPKQGISRAVVRDRIASRLAGHITGASLATWAREQWLNVEGGAATEMGQRELLSETLQTLALSAQSAGQMSDNDLIDLMTRLQ